MADTITGKIVYRNGAKKNIEIESVIVGSCKSEFDITFTTDGHVYHYAQGWVERDVGTFAPVFMLEQNFYECIDEDWILLNADDIERIEITEEDFEYACKKTWGPCLWCGFNKKREESHGHRN